MQQTIFIKWSGTSYSVGRISSGTSCSSGHNSLTVLIDSPPLEVFTFTVLTLPSLPTFTSSTLAKSHWLRFLRIWIQF